MSIELELFSHVEDVSEADCEQLEKWTHQALPECLANPGPGSCDLLSLETVEISIVSDEAIAEVHRQFLNDPTPTDVITFQHGELIISSETAKAIVATQSHTVLEELFLYIVHGLLHLNGHLDKEEADHKEMHRIQDKIWATVLH